MMEMFGIGDRAEESVKPWETEPWYIECRRKTITCIMCAFEEATDATEQEAQLEAAAADVRLRTLAEVVYGKAPEAMRDAWQTPSFALARLATWTGECGARATDFSDARRGACLPL